MTSERDVKFVVSRANCVTRKTVYNFKKDKHKEKQLALPSHARLNHDLDFSNLGKNNSGLLALTNVSDADKKKKGMQLAVVDRKKEARETAKRLEENRDADGDKSGGKTG
jgi:hypothetical protein